MPRLLITAGRQLTPLLMSVREWSLYDEALLVELDTETGVARKVLSWRSLAENSPVEASSHTFKAATQRDDELLLCTQTEVLIVDPATFAIRTVVSHPYFNDLHHVDRIDGLLHVVSTGLDALFVVTDAGELVREHSLVDQDTWVRFDRAVDYRKVVTTKPHEAHPNYVFTTDAGTWVTRSLKFDAVCIDQPGLRIQLGDRPIHDGVAHGASLWFTNVDGTLFHVDARTSQLIASHDLAAMEGRPLGWCRGLRIVDDTLYVAFSRMRATRAKETLKFVMAKLRQGSPPTRVAAYDLRTLKKRAEWDLEEIGCNAIFSLHPSRAQRP